MILALPALLCLAQHGPNSISIPDDPREPHLRNVRQLTFGGQNAEAYWNLEGTKLIFQSSQPEYPDEQIFTMNIDGSDKRLVSTGKGRCTCSYYMPDGKHIVFSSTHATQPGPQPPVDRSKGYVWMVNPHYAMYRANPDGSDLTPLIRRDGYVAETTIAPNGKFMTFTGSWEGDLDIYRCDLDGKHIKRLTHEVGYDGGPFVSWDSKWIVYRRDAERTPAEVEDYKKLLADHLVRPTHLELWIMDPNGRHKRQITRLKAASFAPFVQPDDKHIIFSSNVGDPKGRTFELFRVNFDGAGLEQITHGGQFEGFPMFTRDGKHLVWASNRNGSKPRETNLFVADWVE
ncbi:MAG: PD40 domain-containing protein [Fimbriimonas ginsengisoli]|uniref:PD40 domain-containing protein n=1 Tax=Fimbriimonas ginsengisoli TaxID=1005039 RepID=A0A931LUF4_FIMGI|nr:PD40 domain-containing protein [Fimbriimonas ginsengisoli]